MNENSFFFVLLNLLVTPSPAGPVIYSIKFVVFNFMDTNCIAPKRCHHHENQPVSRPATLDVIFL